MRKSSRVVAILLVVSLAMIAAVQTVPAAEYIVTTSVDYTSSPGGTKPKASNWVSL
jgi:hypothetical protein